MANRIEIIIDSVTKGLEKGLKSSQSGFQKFSKAALGAGVVIAGVVAVGIEKSVHAAMAAQVQTARLATAFKQAGISSTRYAKAVDAAEAAGRKLGFTDEDTKQSLGSLLVATNSYKQSVTQMGIAQNLARFKSVDLAQATKALTMAHAGSLRALKQLGIDIPKVTTAQDLLKASTKKHSGAIYDNALAMAKAKDKATTYANVLATVTGKVKGQADAYSKTAAGGIAKFHAESEHLQVSLGQRLLPILVKVTEKLTALMDFLSTHKDLANALAIGFAALGGALLAAAAGQWAFNIAAEANPYVAAASAIVALTIVLVVLQKKYDAVTKAVQFLTRNWYLLLIPIGLFPALIGFVIQHFGLIDKAIAVTRASIAGLVRAWGSAVDAFHAVVNAGDAVINAFKRVYDWLKKKVRTPDFSGVLAAIDSVVSAIQTAIGWLRRLEFWKGPGASAQGAPTSGSTGNRGGAHRAAGGSVRAFQSYLVGEKGPEMLTIGSKGGMVTPGNRIGGGPAVANIYLDSKLIAQATFNETRNQAQMFSQRTGRPAFS